MERTAHPTNKTLDEAELDFRHIPDRNGAAELLTIATAYWDDAMIGDETYADKVRLVRDWLAEKMAPIDADHEGPIADAARRIASYADGAARITIYRAAKNELKLCRDTGLAQASQRAGATILSGRIAAFHSHPGTCFIGLQIDRPYAHEVRIAVVGDAGCLDHEDLADALHDALGMKPGHDDPKSDFTFACDIVDGLLTSTPSQIGPTV